MGCTRLRELLDAGQTAYGVLVSLTDPGIVEIAALAGYDYVNIDLEHSAIDLQTTENMIRAAHARGISVLLRPVENSEKTILRLVELGPDGLTIPHVLDGADAKRAVDAAKYRPIGDRGIPAASRSTRYGVDLKDFLAFTEKINRELVLSLLIEEKSAAEDIEAIASTEGVDVCFLAPGDLVRSLGYMGSRNDPRAREVIEDMIRKVNAVGKAKLGIPAFHPNFEMDGPAMIAAGFRMIAYGQDTSTLLRGFRENLAKVKAKA